jgi:predicted unusual protein kinase regulating ubiquinone biosynthesis (AarF/ABC1/UbiB family)
VLKVQYPGVAESIPSDIKILESLLKKVMFLKRKGDVDVSSFMEEIKEVLSKEADYLNEQHMQLKYKTKFKGDDFIIPEVYAQYSTKTVLTQEYVEGVSFTQWLDLNPETKVKEKMAHLFMKLYLDEIFYHKLVQTDPNPGNFLITSDEKMVLIDFGAVKEYDHTFVAGYKKVLMYSYMNDQENLLKVSYELQFIDSRESQEVKDIYVKMMDHLVNPFRQEESFDFSDKVFFNTSRDLSWEMSLKCKYSPPPRNLLFLHRKLAGVFTFIKKLQVKIRLKDYWKYVEDA